MGKTTTSEGKQLVMLTGAPRSGTTALVELINCHPDAAITCERYNRLAAQGTLDVGHFASDRLRRFDAGDGSPVSFEMPIMQDALAKLEGARVVGDKIPHPDHVLKFARKAGNIPVIAIMREPLGMAQSYMKRVARAERQVAAGRRATWPLAKDFKAAVTDFNQFLELMKKATGPALRPRPPVLLIDYAELFSGRFPVARIFEFMGLDPAKAVGVDDILMGRDREAFRDDDINGFIARHANFDLYQRLLKDVPE